jgi:RNA polymerase sigma-70 factor (ECF subfamily)
MGAGKSSEHLTSGEPAVRAYLAARLRASEVEDAAQTVMERALERVEVLERADRPRAWLIGVARNVAFEVMRARARTPLPASTAELVDAEQEHAPSAEEQLGALETHERLYQALDALRPDDRLVLLLTYVDGLRGPEAAAVLGVSFAAFRQRLSRARKLAERSFRDLAERPSRVDPAAARAWRRWFDAATDGRDGAAPQS